MTGAGQEALAAEVRALLAEAGVQLALAEAGTGEALARLLCPPPGSAEGVLTRTLPFASPEQLAIALRVSPAKIDAFGALSAIVAAEAAAELIDTYEGGWGLVAMAAPGGNSAEPAGVQSTSGAADCFVALGTPSATIIEQCSQESVARIALELLREQAQRRLTKRR